MPVLLTNSSDFAERHEFTIGDSLKVFNNARELIRVLEDDVHEDIVLVGSDMEIGSATSIAEYFRLTRPSLSVIVIRRRVDVQALNEAIKAGVRDVVPVDDATALVDAVRRARSFSLLARQASGTQQHAGRRGRIVVVFSAKGGCGKTTMATNLSVALGRIGLRVCLIDFDLQFGDVGVSMRVTPTKTISDALSMQRSLDRMGVLGLTIPVTENVDVVLAPTNPTDVELISADLAETVLDRLAEEYDFVIVDSPPAFTEVMIRTFDMADMTLLLTTLDMPALKNLVLSIDTMNALGLQSKRRRVLLNRSDARAGLDVHDVETAIGMPVSGRTESTVDVPASANRGVVLAEWKPKHHFSRAVMDIATLLCEDLEVPVPRKKRGLFKTSRKKRIEGSQT